MSVINLRINNPYARGSIYRFSNGEKFFRRTPIEYTRGPSDILHLVTNYDTLSSLSYSYFGDSKYWWVIAEVNSIHDPFDLQTDYLGKTIVIPDFDKIKAFNL